MKNSVHAFVLFCFVCGTFAAGRTYNLLEYNSLRLSYYHNGEELAAGLADGYLLIGGVPDSVAGPDDGFAQIDRDFILDRVQNHGDDVSTAFQTLVVNELFRRVGQVQRIFGPDTKIVVYGDLWDPQANGGIEKRTFLTRREEICYDHAARKVNCDSDEMDRRAIEMVSRHSKMTPGIGSLPGLAEDQKTAFRKGVILRPWCYYDEEP